MAKKEKGKGLIAEFKAFITRGNIVDMAVGIIIGGAFTAIVTALTGHILTPLINWALSYMGGDGALDSARTILGKPVYLETGEIDWTSTNYIDWGAFISAIINFLLIALVLFIIVKALNAADKRAKEAKAKQLEAYYQKHPEERPVPPAPDAPKPTELDVLSEIRDLLKEKEQNKK